MKQTGFLLGSVIMVISVPGSARPGGGEAEPAPATSAAAVDSAAWVDAPDAVDGPWMDGVPADTQRAAREIFLRGNALIKDTLFAKAAARYKEAIALWRHPAFYFNLAIAQLALDQPIEAHRSLQEALRHGDAPLGRYRYHQARSHLQRLDRELAHVEVICDEAGAMVNLDGVLLFEAPGRYQGLVRPGDHQLVVHKDGYLTETRQLVVSPGQRVAVEVALATLEDTRDSSRRWAAWKPWAVAGAGAALAAASGALHWRASVNYRGFDDAFEKLPCAAAGGCADGSFPAHAATLRRAVWDQRIAVTGYVVGGAVMATGLLLAYLNRPRLTTAESSDAVAVSVAPLVAPRTAGFLALWRF